MYKNAHTHTNTHQQVHIHTSRRTHVGTPNQTCVRIDTCALNACPHVRSRKSGRCKYLRYQGCAYTLCNVCTRTLICATSQSLQPCNSVVVAVRFTTSIFDCHISGPGVVSCLPAATKMFLLFCNCKGKPLIENASSDIDSRNKRKTSGMRHKSCIDSQQMS